MNAALSEVARVKWTPELFSFYKRFPSAIRSSKWVELSSLVHSGKIERAKEIALKLEKRPSVLRQNVMARRARIERVTLFAMLARQERVIRSLYRGAGDSIARAVAKGATEANIPRLVKVIEAVTGELRVKVQSVIVVSLRDAIRLGFNNMGKSLIPIWKANREALQIEEAPLSFGLDGDFARRTTPTIKARSSKWLNITNTLIGKIAKGRIAGLKLSERLWDITRVSRIELRRVLVRGIAAGESSASIANKIKKYLSPSPTDVTIARPGIYKSPFKNAMRIARTETNRAYVWGQAEYSKNKPWAAGVQSTLSSAHRVPDVCDDIAAKGVMSAEEFQSLIPAHPQCMCYPTIVVKPEFLGEDDDE